MLERTDSQSARGLRAVRMLTVVVARQLLVRMAMIWLVVKAVQMQMVGQRHWADLAAKVDQMRFAALVGQMYFAVAEKADQTRFAGRAGRKRFAAKVDRRHCAGLVERVVQKHLAELAERAARKHSAGPFAKAVQSPSFVERPTVW